MADPIIYFCGVWPRSTAGHYCFLTNGAWTHSEHPRSPWGDKYEPLLDTHPDRDDDPRTEDEGVFVHMASDGWTLLAAWDRSGDKRRGSTASFAIQAELEPEAALDVAKRSFPAVFDRIEAHLSRSVVVRPWSRKT